MKNNEKKISNVVLLMIYIFILAINLISLVLAVSTGITDGFGTWEITRIVLLGITEILWTISLVMLIKKIKKEKNFNQENDKE